MSDLQECADKIRNWLEKKRASNELIGEPEGMLMRGFLQAAAKIKILDNRLNKLQGQSGED